MNLCFDECLAPKWFRQLAVMLKKRKSQTDAIHLLDKLKQGAEDDEIVEWLADQEQRLMVVSGDNGSKTKGETPRPHVLCPKRGITSVFISPKLCQREGFEKVRMVMVCIPELEDAYHAKPGMRYRIMEFGRSYKMREWPTSVTSSSDA